MTSTSTLEARIDSMTVETPQWGPWLARIGAALREDAAGCWNCVVVERCPDAGSDAPVLEGALVRVPPALLGDSATTRARQLEANVAQTEGADETLADLPLLCACRRAHGAAALSHWNSGFCPVCGAWPSLAESRGLERARRLRCGRCAADWGFDWLRCPFCKESSHEKLTSFVPQPDRGRRVDGCRSCNGYVKTVSTLAALAPGEIALEDLATVALDVVAIERGFARPKTSRSAARIHIEVLR